MPSKKMIYITIVSFLVPIIIFFVFIPSLNKMQDLSQKIYNKKESLLTKYNHGQKIGETIDALKQAKEDQEKIDALFVKQDEALIFIQSLEKFAQICRLEQSIKIVTATKREANKKEELKKEKLSLAINVKGAFSDIIKYLDLIERGDYYVQVTKLNFLAAESGNQLGSEISGTYLPYSRPINEKNSKDADTILTFEAYVYQD